MNDDIMTELLLVSHLDRYPDAFLTDYEPFECLTNREGCETLLVKSKTSGGFFVAKCYTLGDGVTHVSEAQILQKLNCRGLPHFVGEYRNDGMLCVVREYIKGETLSAYMAKNRPDPARAVAFALELCDILACLHGQTPPVIHRDIKPQNLVVDDAGKLWLIDFGISRVYDNQTDTDTTAMGTRYFAAPEQYGYAQTDPRADIFSLGVLLGWMLTGEAKREAFSRLITDRRLLRVVEKCTAFAPDQRYPTVARLRADLLKVSGRRRTHVRFMVFVALACVVCLCAGFWVGRYTQFASPGGVTFEEPLIGQAVRLQLGVGEGVPVSEADLLKVTQLNLFGRQTVKTGEEYTELNKHMALNDGVLVNGGITTLKDVARLKNLTVLRMALENIGDLSPLAGLTGLEVIDLKHNPVQDVSPLASLPKLTELVLYDTLVTDLTPLAACPRLQTLDLGRTSVQSFSALRGLTALRNLKVQDSPVTSLDGVENLPNLQTLALNEVTGSDAALLTTLPALREVSLNRAPDDKTLQQLQKDGLEVRVP